ncbi:DNA polymerase III subunit gamma/tau [Gilvibacter sp.]|uniref:DNA polymerase III subunit gamma/tau n=1 Tax=Gilvibacter sp. TaxID=2729997 RepID=UPI003F4A55FF
MEHFIVSARKYRPTTFKDVVGQSAITNTLENAIANNHLAQALLFTGPRGVGKTTCARILAKRINADDNTSEDEDFAFNIFELDAASNNSVDDIRSLIDQVRIPPQVGKFKVYIIDEVHMLSAAAFNAFLKTLEEPPKHAIFILATTEKHKIIPTIPSRCQIFDFKRITVKDIKEHLGHVAASEGIQADEDGLQIIAQKADGALRDALSIFDRVVSFSGKNLTRQAVTENLNVLDYTTYFKVTDLVLDNNIPELLLEYDQILSQGFDGHHFIAGLASHFRDLLVGQQPQTNDLLEVGPEIKAKYLDQSQRCSKAFLIEAIEKANACDLQFRSSRNQRLLVELCLMQLASITFDGEKKKSPNYIIPASHFKTVRPAERIDAPQPAVPEVKEAPKEVAEPQAAHPEPVATGPTIADSSPQEPAPAVAEKPKINLNSNSGRRVSALSLKSIKEKQQLQAQSAKDKEDAVLPTEEFTQAALEEHWKAFTTKMERKGRYNLVSHLSMAVPTKEGSRLLLEYPNATIKVELESASHELLGYLREQLKNYDIELDIKVNEEIQKRYAYTPREKYDKLKEINPLMDTLRQEFDLEI